MKDITITGISPGELHRQLMDQYGRYVYTIVYNKLRSCGTREDIEECVSDIISDLFIAADREGAAAVGKLAGTIAKRTAMDYYRRLSARNSRSSDIGDEELAGISSGLFLLCLSYDRSSISTARRYIAPRCMAPTRCPRPKARHLRR